MRIERTERAIRGLLQVANGLEERGLNATLPRQRVRQGEALLDALRASQWHLIRAAAGGL